VSHRCPYNALCWQPCHTHAQVDSHQRLPTLSAPMAPTAARAVRQAGRQPSSWCNTTASSSGRRRRCQTLWGCLKAPCCPARHPASSRSTGACCGGGRERARPRCRRRPPGEGCAAVVSTNAEQRIAHSMATPTHHHHPASARHGDRVTKPAAVGPRLAVIVHALHTRAHLENPVYVKASLHSSTHSPVPAAHKHPKTAPARQVCGRKRGGTMAAAG
jgi:hypothetical protein